MVKYEAVCGVATVDDHYGYLAVRPPLGEQQVADYINALTDSTQAHIGYVARLCLDDNPDVTEFELWSQRGFNTESRTVHPAEVLGRMLRTDGDQLDLLPGPVRVEGAAPLFEQQELQAEEHLATQTS